MNGLNLLLTSINMTVECEAISSLENILLKVSSNTLIYLKALNTLSNFYSLVGREQNMGQTTLI